MKKAFIIAMLVLPATSAFAQSFLKQTVVLDDGSRITGNIIFNSSGFIEMRVAKSSRVILNINSIDTIIKPKRPDFTQSGYNGFGINFSTGILGGNSEAGKVHSLSIQTGTGYRFRNGLSAGIGTGIELMNVLLIPLYADLWYHPFRKRMSPFLSLKCGYSFPVSEYSLDSYYGSGQKTTSGGIMFNAGLGTALYSWRGNAVFIGTGYRFQRICNTREVPYWRENSQRKTITNFNRFEVRFGFIFG